MYNKGVWFSLRSSKGKNHKSGKSERGSIESDLNQSDDSQDNLIRNVGKRGSAIKLIDIYERPSQLDKVAWMF